MLGQEAGGLSLLPLPPKPVPCLLFSTSPGPSSQLTSSHVPGPPASLTIPNLLLQMLLLAKDLKPGSRPRCCRLALWPALSFLGSICSAPLPGQQRRRRGCAGGHGGTAPSQHPPGQGGQPGRRGVTGRGHRGQPSRGCSQEAKCQTSAVAGGKGLPQHPEGTEQSAAIQKNTPRLKPGLGQVFQPLFPYSVSDTDSVFSN